MSLKRRVAALEKHQIEVAALTRLHQHRTRTERLHEFWAEVESALQAQGHWCIPGEDFFRYVTRSAGFDYSRLTRAMAGKDANTLSEFVRSIYCVAPRLQNAWAGEP